MRPLIDRALYDRLRALREGMPDHGVSNLAHVFVPVGPDEAAPGSSALRVLFIGRATRDFGEERVSTYEGATRATEVVAATYMPEEGTPPQSDFWRFARNVLRAALDGSGVPKDTRLTNHLGWSNLAKIGDTKGNATPPSLSIQGELCREALRAEMAAMKPHAVVLATGFLTHRYGEEEVLLPVFGDEGWTQEQAGRAAWRWKSCGTLCPLVVRTEHPQGKFDMGDAAAAIGAKIAAVSATRSAQA